MFSWKFYGFIFHVQIYDPFCVNFCKTCGLVSDCCILLAGKPMRVGVEGVSVRVAKNKKTLKLCLR